MSRWLWRPRFFRPRLSVIVIVYDMDREAPRTLRSLAVPYQRGIAERDYEVIVIDNGSPVPLGEDRVRALGPQFRYHYLRDAQRSPAAALNQGVAKSRGDIVGLFIDGARIASPGLLSTALQGFRLDRDPTVATLGWHLGPEVQNQSIAKGYCRAEEDRLLEAIAWPNDGYRLFEIATLAGSSYRGYFATPAESNALFMTRHAFRELGGFDPAFDLPGGGLVNLDFFIRALEREDAPLIMLLGEGTFHQMHGGAATGVADVGVRFQAWSEQYRMIRGKAWQHPDKPMTLLGALPPAARKSLFDSVDALRAVSSA